MATVVLQQATDMFQLPSSWTTSSGSPTYTGFSDDFFRFAALGSFERESSGYPTSAIVTLAEFDNSDFDDIVNIRIQDISVGSTPDLVAAFRNGYVSTIIPSLLVDNDTVTGSTGADAILAFSGNDVLIGGGSGDALYGGGGLDTASYATAPGAVVADLAQPMRNTGDAAGDTYNSIENLTGSAFADGLYGDSANNTIAGGLGSDSLLGAAGFDAFVFDTALNKRTNVDTIRDFVAADDAIRLDNAIYKSFGAVGSLKKGALANWGVAGQADDRIIYRHLDGADADSRKDTIYLYYDPTGGSRTDAVLFAKLVNQTSVTLKPGDFLIV